MAANLRFRIPLRELLHPHNDSPRRRRRAAANPTLPAQLPARATDPSTFPNMRYARTIPLHSRGDLVATRQRSVLALAAPALDAVVVEPDRPLSLTGLLRREGFLPTSFGDLAPLAAMLSEMARLLKWSGDADEVSGEANIAPRTGAALLRVRVAGDALQLAVYQAEPLAAP